MGALVWAIDCVCARRRRLGLALDLFRSPGGASSQGLTRRSEEGHTRVTRSCTAVCCPMGRMSPSSGTRPPSPARTTSAGFRTVKLACKSERVEVDWDGTCADLTRIFTEGA